MSGRELRTGELAERAGVNVQTLRYYERRGLLTAPARRPSGQRRYPEAAVDRLRTRIDHLTQVRQTLLAVLDADCDLLTNCSCGLSTPLPVP